MIHVGCRNHRNFPAVELHAPAQVYLFHVGEKTLVQAPQSLPHGRTHHQAGTAYPKDMGRGVVLAMVFFHLLENATPAEWVAVAVYQAARRAGVFKTVPFLVGDEFGSAGAAIGMAFHPIHQRLQPAFGYFYVGIDEHVIVGFQLGQGPVVAAGETVVPVQGNQLHLGELGLHQFYGTVGRCIVGHCHFGVQALAGGQQAGEELLQVVPGIIIQYDYCNFHKISRLRSK